MRFFLMAVCLLLAGCAGIDTSALPKGAAAYEVVPVANDTVQREAYRIGALDRLTIVVFQEPELSRDAIQVDASGTLQLPLIGEVRAEGKTALELANELRDRLGARYIVDPQVTVTVSASVSQTVTVEGSVNAPGVYELNGPATLLSALARAQSPTRTARNDQIVVFRVVQGRRMGAVFNINDIRSGKAPDPQILGGDTVVVGYSFVKGGFRDFLTTAPLLGLFRYF